MLRDAAKLHRAAMQALPCRVDHHALRNTRIAPHVILNRHDGADLQLGKTALVPDVGQAHPLTADPEYRLTSRAVAVAPLPGSRMTAERPCRVVDRGDGEGVDGGMYWWRGGDLVPGEGVKSAKATRVSPRGR